MRLINGDCLEEMDKLVVEGVKVDCICTDPPYEHVKGGMKSKRFNSGLMNSDSFLNKNLTSFGKKEVLLFLDKTKNIFRTSYNAYYFCSKLQIPYYLYFATENKLNFDVLIWDRDKNGIMSTKFYSSGIDYVIRIYGKKQGLRNIGNIADKSEYYSKIQKYKKPNNYGHPTEKPIELIKKYILLSTDEGDIVLDPFAGSGTTGKACKNLNRDFILIEKDKKYFDILKTRCEGV